MFTLDNAAMVGWASMYRFLAGDYDDYAVELRAKWSIETLPDRPSHAQEQLKPTGDPYLVPTRLQKSRGP